MACLPVLHSSVAHEFFFTAPLASSLCSCSSCNIESQVDSIITAFSTAPNSAAALMKYTRPFNLFHDLLRRNASEQGRLLGLDVGDKYVGLAVSDINNKIASPLSVLLRKKSNIDLMAGDFQTLISELSLTGFVFGYPFDRQRKCPDAVQVKLFVDDLCKTGKLGGITYTFWDESFTSKNVELLLKPLNLHPVLSKTMVDKFAAVGILQGYLDYVNRNGKLKSEE